MKGIAISTVHPLSNRPTETFHTGFQSELNVRSLVSCPSHRPPTGVTASSMPFRSFNVSNMIATLSFWKMLLLSRRISFITIRSGRVSQHLNVT